MELIGVEMIDFPGQTAPDKGLKPLVPHDQAQPLSPLLFTISKWQSQGSGNVMINPNSQHNDLAAIKR